MGKARAKRKTIKQKTDSNDTNLSVNCVPQKTAIYKNLMMNIVVQFGWWYNRMKDMKEKRKPKSYYKSVYKSYYESVIQQEICMIQS